MPITEEHVFNPNAIQIEDPLEEDLGEYDSYVDKLEAEEGKEEPELEGDATADDETAELDDEAEDEADEVEDDDDEAEDEADEVEDEADEVEDEVEDETLTAEDELADPNENPVVPRERLNQANRLRQEEQQRANMLEAELAQMKSQMESAAEDAGVTNIDQGALKEAAEKALDGDTDAFSNLLAEQMTTITKNMTAQQERMMEKARQDAVAEVRAEQMQRERQEQASVWEEIYPSLDPNSEALHEEALTEAIDLMGMYEAKGYSPAAAMERAVKSVAVNFDLEPAQEAKVATTNPVKKRVVKKRAVKKPVEQPAATGQGGTGKTESPGIDPTAMSQDEWDALPDSVRDKYLMS